MVVLSTGSLAPTGEERNGHAVANTDKKVIRVSGDRAEHAMLVVGNGPSSPAVR